MADLNTIKLPNNTSYSISDNFSKWGGENLLKNIPKHTTPEGYECASYYFSEPLVTGETYTLQV
jgi:hypothetical protein